MGRGAAWKPKVGISIGEIGGGQVGVIEDVEEFRPELQVRGSGNWELFEE